MPGQGDAEAREHGGHGGDHASPAGHVPPPPPLPVVLLDAAGNVLIARGQSAQKPFAIKLPVRVEGELVGYVASPRLPALETQIDRHFREAQLRSLWTVSAFALLVAVIMAVLLARHFTRPLRQLSLAAHRLTQQQYEVSVDDARRDELGALARDMRELASTLARNADARARWFADISHELRTPLAVLLGEIDALLDGVRPLTPERIASLQQEVQHLQRLVEDLYVLARADLGALQYRKMPLDLAELVTERAKAAGAAMAAAGLRLRLLGTDASVMVNGDTDRLCQLVDNLLANSARYTARGGDVHVALAVAGAQAELTVEDTAPGVPDAALPRLFEHLFRVDDARTRSSGGAGLGLAICQRIVQAHGGSIRAEHAAMGGLRIAVMLPLDMNHRFSGTAGGGAAALTDGENA
jgi:two-component system sensor histidine kinase BaeS